MPWRSFNNKLQLIDQVNFLKVEPQLRTKGQHKISVMLIFRKLPVKFDIVRHFIRYILEYVAETKNEKTTIKYLEYIVST